MVVISSLCIPTEDGWERGNNIKYSSNINNNQNLTLKFEENNWDIIWVTMINNIYWTIWIMNNLEWDNIKLNNVKKIKIYKKIN